MRGSYNGDQRECLEGHCSRSGDIVGLYSGGEADFQEYPVPIHWQCGRGENFHGTPENRMSSLGIEPRTSRSSVLRSPS
eukprot:75181-Pelagomonas_calceolata.AAC.1